MQCTLALAVASLVLSSACGARPLAGTRPSPNATANDNRIPAGTLADGALTVALELRPSVWRPNGDSGIALPIAAFAEAGKPASIPGPLLRVVAGTEMRISIRNLLGVRAVVRGLRDHDGTADSLVLTPGETRDVRFTASTVGTHFYFARTTSSAGIMSRGADSQLAGAFIVDPPGSPAASATARDRVFVITSWQDSVAEPLSRYGSRQLFAINGVSWPHTERLSYAVGDTVRWRVVNASQHAHPMHLHGFYFSVLSHGTALDDTLYDAAARHNAVTEIMSAATTMSLQWVPDRAGNWLYHCHFINHVDTEIRLDQPAHPEMSSATGGTHFANAMAGLVLAISVRDTAATRRSERPEPPRRKLRLFVMERAAAESGAKPSYSFVLQEGVREPAADSMRLPGSTIVLHQSEPSQITIINRARHPTVVHWHGMELESYYDGVAGWSGADARTAPLIAPGDSFIVKLTPPRAGTFIYHTHADDLTQLTGGLYGALLVLPAHTTRDPAERVLIFSDSTAPDMRDTPPSLINGSSAPAPIEMCAGTTHRIRFIGISAVTGRRIRLLDDTTLVAWRMLAKDGQDLPLVQQVVKPAAARLATGETMDVAFTPPHPGEYTLEVTSLYGAPRVARMPVFARPNARAQSDDGMREQCEAMSPH
ncbi:MAG: multicopper oxidase domain-containing protein [Gemmatimonadaceae bacterium]|nr:multicopper oxidase domain-containing protein [Gemmatimonadaceae bacterium]